MTGSRFPSALVERSDFNPGWSHTGLKLIKGVGVSIHTFYDDIHWEQ